MEGAKRFLTLKNVQLDQAGEVSYQALNAITSAMLNVKGKFVVPLDKYVYVYMYNVIHRLEQSSHHVLQ